MRPPVIVIVAGAPFHGMRRTARSITDAIDDRCIVVYVDPSTSPLRRHTSRGRGPSVVRETENVWRVRPPRLPAHTRPGVRSFVTRSAARAVRQVLAEVGDADLLLQQSMSIDLIDRIPARVSAFWATDDYEAGAELMGLDPARVHAVVDHAAERVDVVITITDLLAEDWRRRHGNVVVLPNAVDAMDPVPTRDRAASERLGLAGPVAGVVGTLSERLDLGLLEAVVDDGIGLLLVGPSTFRDERARFDAIVARPAVVWLGQVPHEDLPGIYAAMDVGLVPYRDSAFNRASFPLKPLEYLAAGVPVVSTDLPAVSELACDDVTITTTTEGFVAATTAASGAGREASDIERRVSCIAGHRWTERGAQLLSALGIEPG